MKLLFDCFSIFDILHENVNIIETNPNVITHNVEGKETIIIYLVSPDTFCMTSRTWISIFDDIGNDIVNKGFPNIFVMRWE